MDRRTKVILLIIGSLVVVGLVLWFIVYPTLKPLFPTSFMAPQPPTLPSAVTPSGTAAPTPSPAKRASQNIADTVATFSPDASVAAEQRVILGLARRAGVIAERVESGSSANAFENLSNPDAEMTPELVASLGTMRERLRAAHPSTGPLYLTIAQELVARPERQTQISGSTFLVTVQLQIQVRNGTTVTTEYREAAVTFTQSNGAWLASGYSAKAFIPS
jgi:hypothetical protein